MSSTSSRSSRIPRSRRLGARAQMQQVFLFLAAALVIVAAVFLGIKLFGFASDTACGATDSDFRTALRAQLDQGATYGSRRTVSLDAPCGAQRICFVDATMVAGSASAGFTSDDATMTAVVRNGVETNVFLRKEQGMMEAGYDPRIVVDSGFACFTPDRGKLSFRTEGLGRFVKIS